MSERSQPESRPPAGLVLPRPDLVRLPPPAPLPAPGSREPPSSRPAGWPRHSPASDAAHGTCAASALASAPPAPRAPRACFPRRPRLPAVIPGFRLGICLRPRRRPGPDTQASLVAAPRFAPCPPPRPRVSQTNTYAKPVVLTTTSASAAITAFFLLPSTTLITSGGRESRPPAWRQVFFSF